MKLSNVLSARFDTPDSHTLESYRKDGGYETFLKVLEEKRDPDSLIDEVKKSGLKGRGGAGFSTGMKWSFVPKQTEKPKYLCVNGDESEPGTFKDRQILEFDPHALLEGVGLSSYAIGAHTAYVYLRCEFQLGGERVAAAIKEAYEAGLFGKDIQGSGYDLDVYLTVGAGAYICGEETSLLNSIEGVRPYPRNKPPFPAVEGLFACPTIVNNVETITNIPHIIKNGAEWHAKLGHPDDPGSRLWGVSGHVAKPGVFEIETGYKLQDLIDGPCGGMRNGKKLKAIIPGGSSSKVLLPDQVARVTMDTPGIREEGSSLGSAGIIVLDEDTCMVQALVNLMKFYAHESCGQCTPCREGCHWVLEVLERLVHGEGLPGDVDLLLDVTTRMQGKTICFLADSLVMPVQSYIEHYRDEFDALLDAEQTAAHG